MLYQKKLQPFFWGMTHGVNDLIAGFLLANFTLLYNYNESFLFISIYAILGFGGQLPVGLWLDKRKNIANFSGISLLFLFLTIPCFLISIKAGIICSGIASAFVHVTGGTICLQVHNNKSGPLGLFTAPGVLGLTMGSLLDWGNIFLPILFLAAILILSFLIFKTPLPEYKQKEKNESELDSHDLIMLSILLFMCFRSFLFDVVNYVAEFYEHGLLYIGISAFLGKIFGGYVSDKIGIKRFIYCTLIMACILFYFGKENIYMLCMGIAMLQSSVPVTLLMMGRSLPFYPATASAFSLGTSIVLAGLPLFLVSDKRLISDAFHVNWLFVLFFGLLFFLIFFIGKYFFDKKSHNLFSKHT